MTESIEPLKPPKTDPDGQTPHGRAEVPPRERIAEAGGERDFAELPVIEREIRGGFSRGLNLVPGSDDDGWEVPEPVTLPDGTRLQLYKDGEALAAAFAAIKHARKRVLLETYIWSSDETGRAFADLLGWLAGRGVPVFAMYDGFGSFLADREMFERMRRRGVQLIEFHPVRPWENRHSWRPFNRDHRKLMVVDGHIAGLGGLNLGNRYAGTWVAKVKKLEVEELWRDAAVGIVGPGARHFARAFARAWRYSLHRGPIGRTQYVNNLALARAAKGRRLGKSREARFTRPEDYGSRAERPRRADGASPRGMTVEHVFDRGTHLACLATAPTLASPLRPFLHRLLRDARRSIDLTMAYFAPDDELVAGLCAAARRGVRVRLMLAGLSDAPIVIQAGRSFYQTLMTAGVQIFERQHVMLHQKSIVVDGVVSMLGSTNLDYRSIELNLELSAVVRSEQFGRQMQDLFEHDMQFADRIDPATWHERPWRDRLVQWAVSRMRYLL